MKNVFNHLLIHSKKGSAFRSPVLLVSPLLTQVLHHREVTIVCCQLQCYVTIPIHHILVSPRLTQAPLLSGSLKCSSQPRASILTRSV